MIWNGRAASTSGLTIVEVLVALVLVAIVIVALTMTQATSLQVSRNSVLASNATQTANSALELVTQEILNDYQAFQLCPGPANCSKTLDSGQFKVAYQVQRANTYVLSGLVRVDVTVSGPASAELHQYVSCMDVSPAPTVAKPGVCG